MLCVDQRLDGGGGDREKSSGEKQKRHGGGVVVDVRKCASSPCVPVSTATAAALFGSEPPEPVLDIPWQHLGGSKLHALFASRSQDQLAQLVNINLAGNRLNELSSSDLQSIFKPMVNLSSLNISHNTLGAEGTLALLRALDCKAALRHLDISYNAINARCAGELGQCLSQFPNLESLDASMNPLKGSGVASLVSLLPSSVTKLVVSQAGINDDGLALITKAFDTATSTVQELDLAGNQISSYQTVGQLLHQGTNSLTTIDLRRNKLSAACKAQLRADQAKAVASRAKCSLAFASALHPQLAQVETSPVSLLQQDPYLMQLLLSTIWPASDAKTLLL